MSSEFELDFNDFLNKCDDKDVISFKSDKLFSISKLKSSLSTIIKYRATKTIHDHITSEFPLNHNYTWFTDGEECEILKAGSGWQKGKIKININVEFIPDTATENQSPLDDLRQEINNSNS